LPPGQADWLNDWTPPGKYLDWGRERTAQHTWPRIWRSISTCWPRRSAEVASRDTSSLGLSTGRSLR